MSNDNLLPSGVRIGHVHLSVSDLDRAIAFYRDAIGFTVTVDGRPVNLPVVFLAAGDYHHHLALNTFQSSGGSPSPTGHTGLYHLAILYPDRRCFVQAVARVLAHGGLIESGRDHGATVSVYLKDPDQNGIELYYDRPREEWFDHDGQFVLKNDPFDVSAMLAEAPVDTRLSAIAAENPGAAASAQVLIGDTGS